MEALKILISRLPRGEDLGWSDRFVPQTPLPPDEIIEEIKMLCESRGITLRVNRRGAG
jgi:hypothetical protein